MPSPKEATQAVILPPQGGAPDAAAVITPVAVTPTQVRRPWRATVRTVFQTVLALATLIPFVVAGIYDDADQVPVVVAQVVVIAGLITKIMAMPQVEQFLQDHLSWLAAAPAAPSENQE